MKRITILLAALAVASTATCVALYVNHNQKIEELETAYKKIDLYYVVPDQQAPQEQLKPVAKPEPKLVSRTELNCLAENIYYEAGGESLAGKMAVGLVTLNRAKSGQYPKSVCGVVNQKVNGICQFAWVCNPIKHMTYNSKQWKDSMRVATYLLTNTPFDITEGSTHFHNQSVKPEWKNVVKTARIGNHTFYSRESRKEKETKRKHVENLAKV